MRESGAWRAGLYTGIVLMLALAFAFMPLHARAKAALMQKAHAERRELVKSLGLTDLCLFTEARYTRHPSQADLHSPFQDHPASLEHFPSGALMGPPPHIGGPG